MMIAASLALLLTADPDVAKLDDLWAKRDDPATMTTIAGMIDQFKTTSDYDKLWRAARYYDWMADGAPDDDQKKGFGKTGWDIGENAKKANPAGLEGKYWSSVCIGAYSESVGILKAISNGLEGKFRDPIMDVVKADPSYQNANVGYVGPVIAIGRYYDRLPWPKHSTNKAKEWLNKAIAAHPEALRAHYYLADAIKGDDKEAAKKELNLVLAGDEAYDGPEARRIKKWSKALLDKISK
jgi:hypothetical protein